MIVKSLERVISANDLHHPIIREAFHLLGIEGRYLEMTRMADIPAGTGLGSSASFTTALLKAPHAYHVRYDKRAATSDMRHIDYGVALLRRAALARIPPNAFYDLADLYRDLVDEGLMVGYEVTERFYEIGSPEGLAETRAWFAQQAQV